MFLYVINSSVSTNISAVLGSETGSLRYLPKTRSAKVGRNSSVWGLLLISRPMETPSQETRVLCHRARVFPSLFGMVFP